MKKTIGILSVILLVACSPDQKLVEENELLKLQVEEIRKVAEEAAQEAQMAQARAIAAAEEAEKQRQAAVEAAERAKDCN